MNLKVQYKELIQESIVSIEFNAQSDTI